VGALSPEENHKRESGKVKCKRDSGNDESGVILPISGFQKKPSYSYLMVRRFLWETTYRR
jgi:hypothetical protein